MIFWEKIRTFFYQTQEWIGERINFLFGISFIRAYLLILFFLNIAIFLFAIFVFQRISPEARDLIALHYNVDFGVNLIGKAHGIFVFPVLSLAVFVINFSLLLGLYRAKDKIFLAHLLLASALGVNVILFIGVFSVYLINFR